MRVLVCGGRDFSNRRGLFEVLDKQHRFKEITEIVEGDARGADRMAGEWAKENGVKLTAVPAKWDIHGKKAGFLRNVEMADLNPDLCLAFEGGVGTEMMLRICSERGIKHVHLRKETSDA